MDTKLSIEKLDNGNYFTWKYRIEMLLKKEGLWKILSQSRPAATAPATELNSWLEKDEKAMAIIGLSVMDNQLQHIRNMTSAMDSWKALQNFHEQKTLVNTTTLMRNLWDLKLNEDMNPQSHIQEMTNILQKLVDLGEPDLTDKWKTAILLSSLPDCYHTLVTALEARDSSQLTFALVQSKVLDEFKRRNLHTNGDNQVLKIQQKGTDTKYCYYCNEPNHLMRNCWKFKQDIENGQQHRNCAIIQSDEDSEEEINDKEMLF